MAEVTLTQTKIKIPDELVVLPLRKDVVFPNSIIPLLQFSRPKIKKAIDEATTTSGLAIFVAQKSETVDNPGPNDIYQVGTVCAIRRIWKSDNEYHTAVEGLSRVYLKEFTQVEPFMKVKVDEIPQFAENAEDVDALVRNIQNKIRTYAELGGPISIEASISAFSSEDANQVVNIITANLADLKTVEKQQILEMVDIRKRLERLSEILQKEIRILEINQKIDTETQERVGKVTKEAILREKMRSIEKELGEDDDQREIDELEEQIKNAHMPKDVDKKARKELGRLAKMSSYNPESAYIRTYLETLIEMPWQAKSTKAINIHDSEKILEEDHYGLPKAKERILEYLAVNKLVGKIRGPILCFYGPPGVGKTSIGKSIAKSLGREFVRMSLGGVHDEAEIRGHRRTYVGAMPGRIIQGIKNSGSTNPVFMLDEIDKVTSNYRGDPSAALLEALDPEQNNSFSDHYLEVPYDLSDVMFIATANQLNTIPDALLDRMEVIDFPGYTEEEKFNIAKNFLLPKQLKNHGLKSDKIIFEDSSLREIISKYTREAGVRNLEREIGTVCRKIAKAVATNEIKSIKVSSKNLEKFLGIEKFKHTLADSHDDIGIATGLSVTNVGGEILFIEVSVIPGKGQLMLTGQLGDVMKESAHAAMSYIRSRWKKLGLKKNFNQEVDIHIHVPEGGIPKEGPSAGTAIATALISALTKKKSISSVGMTGEITLRGRVLPIGGVKEKVLAAHRAGLKTVILPLDNKKDTEEIAQNIKKDLTLVFVKHLDEVLRVAFKSSKKGGGSGSLNKKSPVKRKHPITTIGA